MLILLRVTVGLAFVMMGSWKIGSNAYHMGGRVGELFTFMEGTGVWWDLVGWTQVLAGILLITQRFATFGTLVLFAVTVNIAAVNIALWPEFGTTVWLTAYAGGALFLLLLHDLDKWQYIFWKRPPVVVPGAAVDPLDASMPLTTPVFHILLSLCDDPKHEYAILDELAERSSDALRIEPVTLDSALSRLRDQGLIEEVEDFRVPRSPEEERWRYYGLTGEGRALAAAEAARLERLVEVARRRRLVGLDHA